MKSLNPLGLTAVAAVLGIALALLAVPLLYPFLPNDLKRTQVLLEVLRDPKHQPQIVILGNSTIMNGIDAHILEDRLSIQPIFNLASTGQSASESLLYYQELPDSTRAVVQFLSPLEITEMNLLSENVYNAFYMYGYRPRENTQHALQNVYGPYINTLFRRSSWWHYFRARWVLRQTIDRSIRNMLRGDLDLARGERDLYHPAPYTTRLPTEKMQLLLQNLDLAARGKLFRVSEKANSILREQRILAEQHEIKILHVINPMHPRYFRDSGPALRTKVATFINSNNESSKFKIVSAIELINEEHFYDAMHPDGTGATILSEWLVKQLKGLL